jgi:hypothetical protein
MFKVKVVVKAIWQFCSYLFVPQWGEKPKDASLEA